MGMTRKFLCALASLAAASPAFAGPVLDRIRAEGVVRCGGEERPGLIAIEDDGKAAGLELDLCRAIASVVLGPDGKLEFRRYDSAKAYNALRERSDDVSFLSAHEMIVNQLAGQLIPGPTVFVESTVVMTPDESPVQHLSELAGQPICFSILQPAQYHLDGWFAARHLDYIRMGFQEDGEMNDGYTVHYCKAIAGEITTLADTRASGETARSKHRFLPETLATYPIVAATPVKDGEWASIVAWTIQTLMAAEARETEFTVGGTKALPVKAPELGLAPDWQQRLIALVGTYGDLYERNLGDKSALKIPRGLNASVADGGALAVLHAE